MNLENEVIALREELTNTRIQAAEMARDVANFAKTTEKAHDELKSWFIKAVIAYLGTVTGLAGWLLKLSLGGA